MKQINFIIVLIILASTVSAQLIHLENETIEITNILNPDICENTTKVFRIERLNHSENSSKLKINYLQKWNAEEYEIEKEINKYTQSKTGNVNIKQKENDLVFKYENQIINWKVNFSCFEEEENLSKVNETKNNNTILIQINKTNNSEINLTMNKSEIQNMTSENISQRMVLENNTEENSSEIETGKEEKDEIRIEVNKELFLEGEKLRFRFSNNENDLTYWIEDIEGNIVKTKYNTDNDNEKTFTIKSQEEKEKIFIIRGKGEENYSRLIGAYKEEIAGTETKIELEAKYENERIEINMMANRGESKKTTIYCYTQTNQKTSSEEYKSKIKNQNQEIETTIFIYPKKEWSDETKIICEGLDQKEELIINTPQKEKEEIKCEEIDLEEIKEEMKFECEEEKETEKLNEIKNNSNLKKLKEVKLDEIKNKQNKITGNVINSEGYEKETKSTKIIIGSIAIIGLIMIIIKKGDTFIKK